MGALRDPQRMAETAPRYPKRNRKAFCVRWCMGFSRIFSTVRLKAGHQLALVNDWG